MSRFCRGLSLLVADHLLPPLPRSVYGMNEKGSFWLVLQVLLLSAAAGSVVGFVTSSMCDGMHLDWEPRGSRYIIIMELGRNFHIYDGLSGHTSGIMM